MDCQTRVKLIIMLLNTRRRSTRRCIAFLVGARFYPSLVRDSIAFRNKLQPHDAIVRLQAGKALPIAGGRSLRSHKKLSGSVGRLLHVHGTMRRSMGNSLCRRKPSWRVPGGKMLVRKSLPGTCARPLRRCKSFARHLCIFLLSGS